MVAFAAPAGIQLPRVLITTKTLTDVVFWGSATVTATNMVVKVNDSAAYVTGYNAIGSTFGQKPYEFVRDTSKIGSDIVFAFGLQNIMVYGTNRNRREEVQSEGCRKTDFYVTPRGTAIPSESYHSLSNADARKWYLAQETTIPDLIDYNQSLEQQAYQAFSMRNEFRITTRELTTDRELAESLYLAYLNRTWEEMIEKQIRNGLNGDDIYKAIIESSQHSRSAVNKTLGLE